MGGRNFTTPILNSPKRFYNMRILIINNLFPPGFIGGYELGAYDVAHYLSKKQHDVTVLTSRTHLSAEKASYPFEVRRLLRCVTWDVEQNTHRTVVSEGLLISAQNIRVLRDFLDLSHDYDLILCFNLSGLGTVGILHFLSLLSIPTCVFLMDNLFVDAKNDFMSMDRLLDLTGARGSLESVRWLAMSQQLLNEVRNYSNLTMPRADIIPGWAEIVGECKEDENQSDYIYDDATGGKKRFVYCSRISETKGTFLCLDACKMLLDARVNNFSLDIYGNGDVDELLRLIEENDLGQHVFFRGELTKNRMIERFANYNALLFPTWPREPFGFVAAEAAAAGCIPIMTAGTGASEWFIHNKDCIKIHQSVASLRAAMLEFIALDAEKLKSMKEEAKSTVKQFLSKSIVLGNLEEKLSLEIKAPRTSALSSDLAEKIITIFSSQWKWLHSS